MFSNFNLVLLNLWIGLCRGVEGLPSIFRELGYRDWRIEEQVFLIDEQETVHPEIIIFSVDTSHTVLVESKAGANTDEDQLRRYYLVTDRDLRESAYIDARALGFVDIGIFGLEEHGNRLRIGIEDGEYSFPLVLAGESGLTIRLNEFSVDDFDDAFRPALEIDWSSVPTHFVPVNESSEHWEFAEPVMQKLLQVMCQRAGRVTVREIAVSICEATWGHIAGPGRQTITSKIGEVLRHAARHQFSDYIGWEGEGEAVEIRRNPLDHDPSQQTRSFQRLQRLTEDFLDDLRGGALQTEFDFDQE